jgi:FdhD protein
MDKTTNVKITRVDDELSKSLEDTVIREYPITIYVNDQMLFTLLCTPEDIECMVVGHLLSESLIHTFSEIKALVIDMEKGLVYVTLDKTIDTSMNHRYITSGCASSALYYNTLDAITLRHLEARVPLAYDKETIFSNMKLLNQKSSLFRETGGVHMAGVFREGELLCIYEDIGRHNAVDKAIGYLLKEEIGTEDVFIYVSGRISSEMVLKCIKAGIGGIISRSAPMDLAVRLAIKHGIILIGFVRGRRMNIYT